MTKKGNKEDNILSFDRTRMLFRELSEDLDKFELRDFFFNEVEGFWVIDGKHRTRGLFYKPDPEELSGREYYPAITIGMLNKMFLQFDSLITGGKVKEVDDDSLNEKVVFSNFVNSIKSEKLTIKRFDPIIRINRFGNIMISPFLFNNEDSSTFPSIIYKNSTIYGKGGYTVSSDYGFSFGTDVYRFPTKGEFSLWKRTYGDLPKFLKRAKELDLIGYEMFDSLWEYLTSKYYGLRRESNDVIRSDITGGQVIFHNPNSIELRDQVGRGFFGSSIGKDQRNFMFVRPMKSGLDKIFLGL